ncbi:hypothetical protein RF11_12120 [Thelohanellus kitauei]|uniref:Uncharacterized protein n=1 Tax=Thelohanellus kitauei TaxID=669202 RepID=A0A0C2I8Y8_THEKT|nr:hypothetical protein RF11_12120 [Thelohanellus kitauei]
MALSDELYIKQLQEHEKLFLYEDIKSTCISMIPNAFLIHIFSESGAGTSEIFQVRLLNDLVYSKYMEYNDLMKIIIESFNVSNYIEYSKAVDYLVLCRKDTRQLPHIRFISNNTLNIYYLTFGSETLEYAKKHDRSFFLGRLKWFGLIFELKFIFGNIRGKFGDFNF